MNKLIAIIYFVLSLYGCEVGGDTYVDRIRVDGVDALYSKVLAQPAVTRFECLRSVSGHCYYTVYAKDCASRPGARGKPGVCLSEPVEHFPLAKGGSREIPALPRFRLCVSTQDGAPGPDCDVPQPMATQ